MIALESKASATVERKICTVKASGTYQTDDAPAIRAAFEECGQHGKVVFNPTTYYVNSVMRVSGLNDVDIDIQGELLWSTDIRYWLNASLPVGYQNQSTAFILGGDNVRINGHGVGTLNGNGDYWYEWIRQQPNTSNYPGRPHAITFNGLTNSVVKGLKFLRSQMWTMSIIHSHDNVWEDIFVNNTGNKVSSSNTDGVDTFFSSNLLFRNLTVYNGDDSFSCKANSTNITLIDSKFYHGLGIAIGSIGQYNDQFETIENIRAENVYFEDTLHAFYVKTWTDDQNGYPPNGGGGGLGFAENMSMKNLTIKGMRGAAFSISQCTRFSGAPGAGNCTNSQFQVRDVDIQGMKGTTKDRRTISLQCSAVAPCTDIAVSDVNLRYTNGTSVANYLCGNVVGNHGFNCTGPVCVGGSSTGGC
ncbi:glycoside hydrolase family 28 protein [Dothidotthia symphoricarpi CBS 119687]|uniref:Glycoside hydrolase family 28 protein n=1 Tax=Dothidotthia symphoricarpi CBS 119687 TaxID=1392245 RepID=A0A6A5ZWV4_9PLEO|nr:glycoside hydrolase family 28 protein [Dothidotthia symphoricarpi CBS 119687]KAF2124060.1 glycoside hydrolase family 28 protein [Dothidotthia symphoricarpi CBS 119687]